MTDNWWDDFLPGTDNIVLKGSNSNFVHPHDDEFVEWLFSLVGRNPFSGPWIAGGSCLRWYQRQPAVTDIDVFFSHKKQWDLWISALANNLGSVFDPHVKPDMQVSSPPFQSANAWTYDITFKNKQYKLQLIKKHFFSTAQDVIDRFDISVCQIAMDRDSNITVGDYFARDVAAKQFRLNNITDSTVPRVLKYMCYGFEPVDGVKDMVLNSDPEKWVVTGDYHAF